MESNSLKPPPPPPPIDLSQNPQMNNIPQVLKQNALFYVKGIKQYLRPGNYGRKALYLIGRLNILY